MPASSSTFGPQWPYPNPYIRTLVRSDGLRIPLHLELISLVSMLMDLTESMGYDIVPGWTWGYSYRPISGTNVASNHSRGCAVDINAPVNPYASADWHQRNARGTRPFGLALVCDIPQAVVELWEDHGFYWGGRYGGKPDPMHFEFTPSLTECRLITALLQQHLNHPAAALPQPAPKEDDMIRIQKFHGEDRRVAGDQPDVDSLYRVTSMEVAPGRRVDVDAYHMPSGTLDEFVDLGYKVHSDALPADKLRPVIRFHGGPFFNV